MNTVGTETGKRVCLSVDDEEVSLQARLLHVSDRTYTLQTQGPADVLIGKRVTISSDDAAVVAAVVREIDGDRVTLEEIDTDKRAYFRVDDVFPLKVRRIERGCSSRFISFYPPTRQTTVPATEYEENDLIPLLREINGKLDFLINTLVLKEEGLMLEEGVAVNISAAGMRFVQEEMVEQGDILEIKMVLPAYPPLAILVCGEVVCVREEGKAYVTAVKFIEMTDEVREEIIQYTLRRQREIIKRQRGGG